MPSTTTRSRANPRALRAAALRERAEANQAPTDAVLVAWEVCRYANGSCACAVLRRGRPTACASIMPTAERVLRIAKGEAR